MNFNGVWDDLNSHGEHQFNQQDYNVPRRCSVLQSDPLQQTGLRASSIVPRIDISRLWAYRPAMSFSTDTVGAEKIAVKANMSTGDEHAPLEQNDR